MKECYKPNYNSEGVDINRYTLRRHEEVEHYADTLDYLRESNKFYYDMITTMISMCALIDYDVRDWENNISKNSAIKSLLRLKDKKNFRTVKQIIYAFSESEHKERRKF